MIIGTVHSFNEFRGYGFIVPEFEKKDLFVHKSAIINAKSLNIGQKVSFIEIEGKRGMQAIDVRVLD